MHYRISAQTLKETLQLSVNSLAPAEVVRVHSILAVRLATAEQFQEAIAEAMVATEETEKRLDPLGTFASMTYVGVAVPTTLAGDCELNLSYVARANSLTNGEIGPDHRANFDSAHGICLVRTGKPVEGLAMIRSVIEKNKIPANPAMSNYR